MAREGDGPRQIAQAQNECVGGEEAKTSSGSGRIQMNLTIYSARRCGIIPLHSVMKINIGLRPQLSLHTSVHRLQSHMKMSGKTLLGSAGGASVTATALMREIALKGDTRTESSCWPIMAVIGLQQWRLFSMHLPSHIASPRGRGMCCAKPEDETLADVYTRTSLQSDPNLV